MPTYRPYTRVQDLPANSSGERTILEAHLDAAHATITDVLEYLAQAVWSAGGVVIPGTVTNPSDAIVRVQDRLGVTSDAKTLLAVGDQSVDLAGVATSTMCLVVIRAMAGASTSHSFIDSTTGESITHSLLSAWGKLEVVQGDASNYPPLPADSVPVAEVTKTGAATLTLDSVITSAPTPRVGGGGSGDVVGPGSAVDGNLAVFDGTDGKSLKDGGPVPGGSGGGPISINAQTGTTYTLQLSDAQKLVTHDNVAAVTLTVPTNASQSFTTGDVIAGAQLGAGLVSIVGAAGVEINGTTPGDEKSAGQWSTWALTYRGSDKWLLSGGTA